MRDVQGYPGPLIAWTLGLSNAAMKSRLHRPGPPCGSHWHRPIRQLNERFSHEDRRPCGFRGERGHRQAGPCHGGLRRPLGSAAPCARCPRFRPGDRLGRPGAGRRSPVAGPATLLAAPLGLVALRGCPTRTVEEELNRNDPALVRSLPTGRSSYVG
ncbi:hypothetical protein ACFVTY_29905 [Streptomyces sp. NPDC058067]|uniref:hypothetical protein n=1 Tax=Streptomyces sp. NPDC058067 TaxID=3346324 RepID=UPI0036E31E0A